MLKNKFINLAAFVALFFWFTEVAFHVFIFKTGNFKEVLFASNDPNELWMRIVIVFVILVAGYISQQMANRIAKAYERERELSTKLEASLKEIKLLQRILPICSSCKKIRDDKGYWSQVEAYISAHSEIQFSHGIYPECAQKLYPEFYDEIL